MQKNQSHKDNFWPCNFIGRFGCAGRTICTRINILHIASSCATGHLFLLVLFHYYFWSRSAIAAVFLLSVAIIAGRKKYTRDTSQNIWFCCTFDASIFLLSHIFCIRLLAILLAGQSNFICFSCQRFCVGQKNVCRDGLIWKSLWAFIYIKSQWI